MRRLLLVAVLVACGSGKSTGPAWPAPSTTAEDGGESLDPRESAKVAAAIEKAEDAQPDAEPETPDATPAAATGEPDKPAATPEVSQPSNDDIIFSEEIIIEIDDE